MKQLLLVLLSVLLLSALTQGQTYDYAEALQKSLLFYEAQRSGVLPADNRIPWRGDSLVDDVVPGGYYDAGDFVKFGFPGAFSNTILAWGAITFQAGYDSAGETANLKSCLKQFTDYYIAAHISKYEFYGQVGDGLLDHDYWGRPEEMPNNMPRPGFLMTASEPGSDLIGETAAALAASSIVYRNLGDDDLADSALSHARDLFDFADQYRGLYSDVIPDAEEFYASSDYGDELTWAAAWLYKATNEEAYLTKAEELFDEFGLDYVDQYGFYWDSKLVGAQILLFEATGKAVYRRLVEDTVDFYLNDATYTPKGLLFLDEWGSLPLAANTALALLHVAEAGIQTAALETLARNQMGYILGDTGRSFVVGFGVNPPLRVHHAAASCPDQPQVCDWDAFDSPAPNPQVINGALAAGPDDNDNYDDSRDNYVQNEVTLDYNAGFQGLLAAVINLENRKIEKQ